MKVLHVVPTYWPAIRYGGPIYSVHGLCAALAGIGCDVHVYTTSVDGYGDLAVEHGKQYLKDDVAIFYHRSSCLRRIYYSAPLKKMLVENIHKFDLVHLHSIFLYPTNIAARLAMAHNVPYIVSPRGMLEKDLIRNKSFLIKSSWLALIERKTLEQSSLIHVTSQRELNKLNQFDYAFPATTIIPNGVDMALLSESREKLNTTQFQVLFLGRLSWKKQINKLIESVSFLEFNLKLLIVGNDEDNYETKLKDLVNRLNINQKNNLSIEFLGAKYEDEKKRLFETSDVMVLPSLSENFGNTVIEAMATGCPVIVTPEVGASEIVKRTSAGLITDGTPEDIAKNIRYIYENPHHARQMSINGINEVDSNYRWPVIAQTMVDAYQRILN